MMQACLSSIVLSSLHTALLTTGHIHNVGSRTPGCSWSGGCNELGWWMLQNADEAMMQACSSSNVLSSLHTALLTTGHIHNVGSRTPGCSWSGGCNELGWWMLQNADEATMQACCHQMFVGMLRTGFWLVNVPPSFPGLDFQQMVIARLSLGLSFFSPEISEISKKIASMYHVPRSQSLSICMVKQESIFLSTDSCEIVPWDMKMGMVMAWQTTATTPFKW